MARLNLTRPRLFGFGLAAASLAFAACGGKSSTPTPVSSVSAAPTPTGSAPISLSSPCASSVGIAYESDGGNSTTFNGIQVSHFEDNNEHLCSAVTPTSLTSGIRLDAPVGPFAFAEGLSDAIALLYDSSTGGYSYAQDLFGAAVGQLVPAGTAYNLSLAATPVPSSSSSPSATASLTPALMTDSTSVTILDESALGVALFVSPNTSPQSIVALTSLTNAPPQYGNSVPFVGATNTLKTPSSTSFNNIRATTDTAGISNVLVRGTDDLLAIGVVGASTGYQFNIEAEDRNLGSNAALRGYGKMAMNPANATVALIGGNSAGQGNVLTFVTGLPSTITEASKVTLAGNINSIQFTPQYGSYAVVGTTAGIVVVGAQSGVVRVLTPFGPTISAYQPTFTDCNGAKATMTNVLSVGLSADLKYLVALGVGNGVACASGNNATIVAVPFLGGTGATPAPTSLATPTAAPSGSPSPSPFPTFFQQNNVIAPPTNADYLIVH